MAVDIGKSAKDAFQALQDGIGALKATAARTISPIFTLTSALKSFAIAAVEGVKILGEMGKMIGEGVAKSTQNIKNLITNLAIGAVALGVLEKSIGAVGSQIGKFVQLANPAVFQLFDRAIKDLYASIGRVLVPILEKATQVFRSIGTAIFSMTGDGNRAVQLFGVLSVGLVALGAIIAALGVKAVITAVGMTVFGAAMAVIEAIATGGIGPILSAIGASLGAIGTVGATLAGVAAAITAVFAGMQGVLGNLQPVLDRLSQVFVSFMDDIGKAFSSFTGVDVLGPIVDIIAKAAQVVGSVIKEIAPGIASLVSVLVKMLPVTAAIIGLLAAPILVPLLAILTPIVASVYAVVKALEKFRPALEAIAEALSGALSEVAQLVFDVLKEIGSAIGILLGSFGGLGDTLNSVVVYITAFARALKQVVADIIGWIRGLLGIPATPTEGPKPSKLVSNVGAAATSASTTSPESVLAKARESAFSLGTGANPAKATADNTKSISDQVKQMTADMISAWNDFKENYVRPIGTAVENIKDFITNAKETAEKVGDIASNPIRTGSDIGSFLASQVRGILG